MKRKAQFCCDASRDMYEDYYAKQSGGSMPVFVGTKRQRGHGIGSMLIAERSVQKRGVTLSERKRGFASWKRAEDGRSSVGRCGTGQVVESYGKKANTRRYKSRCTRHRLADWFGKAGA